MTEYILFMHGDAPVDPVMGDWSVYIASLKKAGRFDGGSGIGDGQCYRKTGIAPPTSDQITGYIRIRAIDLAEARNFLAGNPVFEAGGTVEIRELPKT